MFHFEITDINSGLKHILRQLGEQGITENSRNGPVLRFPRPVCIEYPNPTARVMSWPTRDANPFFHLFETMWMFAGMDEIQPLLLYNQQMAQYSDDGKILRGTAYGKRWRSTWGDQLLRAVDLLKKNPESRQVVMSMWNPQEIFTTDSKDFACNLQVLFSTRPSSSFDTSSRRILDMTVTNRSNDLIYGAMGSNLFHFSMLLEYVALHASLEIGTYYQIANNLHLYTENETAAKCYAEAHKSEEGFRPPIEDNSLTEIGLSLNPKEIEPYVRNHEYPLDPAGYLARVVRPLVEAYRLYKIKTRFGISTALNPRIDVAIEMCANSESIPLATECAKWLERRRPWSGTQT